MSTQQLQQEDDECREQEAVKRFNDRWSPNPQEELQCMDCGQDPEHCKCSGRD